MLTLLTATGCRPEAWRHCMRLMMRQTYAGHVRWVIVDDGEEAQPAKFERAGWKVESIRRRPYWKEGQNTQAANMKAGLDAIDASERVAVIEDDDWYSPDWLATVDKQLNRAELVGETRARYYNVARRRYRQLQNTTHASLCATALRGRALDTLRTACGQHQFIDLDLWRRHPSKALFEGHRVVGIKGLPGRCGIGMGHKDNFRGASDNTGATLREWLGSDAAFYLA